MARKKKNENEEKESGSKTRRVVGAIFLGALGIIFILARFGAAGVAGDFVYGKILHPVFGFGFILIPLLTFTFALFLIRPMAIKVRWQESIGGLGLLLATLGILHIMIPQMADGISGGGTLGKLIGSGFVSAFDTVASIIILIAIGIAGFVVLFNEELSIPDWLKNMFRKEETEEDTALEEESALVLSEKDEEVDALDEDEQEVEVDDEPEEVNDDGTEEIDTFVKGTKTSGWRSDYTPPPVSLLEKNSGKPTTGDLKAQGNLIKRTLQNFGIDVEMDEVSTGPTVTRYTLKPAEGVKLSRITALRQDLSLALAAHPIRIEAPIPGKSLVGIEIPNRTKATVGLGSLIEEKIFQDDPRRLFVALGKTVTGKSRYADIAKMPHLLIAGTTGSGKSITVHDLIVSLLYRNGPEYLRFIMIDPKRVELTLYGGIPHLLTPVIKDAKKAILSLRWAAKEMERRYDILETKSCRDISSYHKTIVEPYYKKESGHGAEDPDAPERMPYIVIIIDELADIMQTYPRDLEAAIVRLAQMSRATGIHLILSTQRPSVNVITGLIKANIPARLALQVASQIDSRTILDQGGAETLLGAGDMLFQGSDMSQPERMQSAFVSESEVKEVVSFIKKHNDPMEEELAIADIPNGSVASGGDLSENGDDDELYEEAKAIVIEAGKASTSYIQRKLKVGYSRAARLLDLLEERNVVGPADGSKPREVLQKASPE